MDKIFEINLLFDFYGQLLTKRQQEIFDMHINSDCSLGEIAEQLNITRQGVYDNIRRAKISLNEFEDNLKLVEKFLKQKIKTENVLKLLNNLERSEISKRNIEIINKIETNIVEIVNDI